MVLKQNIFKYISIILIIIGMVFGTIGFLLGGANDLDFSFISNLQF